MKISKLLIPVAAAALLALGGATFAQTTDKKPINTSAGAGAPMNFPTPMPNQNGDYTQGGQAYSGGRRREAGNKEDEDVRSIRKRRRAAHSSAGSLNGPHARQLEIVMRHVTHDDRI